MLPRSELVGSVWERHTPRAFQSACMKTLLTFHKIPGKRGRKGDRGDKGEQGVPGLDGMIVSSIEMHVKKIVFHIFILFVFVFP